MKFLKLKSFFKRNVVNDTKDNEQKNEKCKSPLSIYRKISYGLGGLPPLMISNATGFYLSIFLLETAQISPYSFSIIQIITRIWDAISDPLSGYFVSITKSRFGKFKPWIFFATPITCLAFFLVFFVPETQNQAVKCIFYGVVFVSLQTGLTALYVPYSSMCMALTSNVKERDQLTSLRMSFEIVGILFGTGIFGTIALRNRIQSMETSNITSEMYTEEKNSYMVASAVLCLIFVVCIIFLLVGTKETEIYNDEIKESYLKCLKKIILFKPYAMLMLSYMFASLGIQMMQFNAAIYITHVLKIPSEVTRGIVALLFCSLAFIPLGHILMTRFGKKVIYFVGGCNMFPALIVFMILPENVNLWAYYSFIIWVSFSLMVIMVIPWSMLPDVIDMFMIINGSQKETVFFSFYVFFNKFAVGISVAMSAAVIGLAGYKPGAKDQPESVATMMRYFVPLSGIVCIMIAMIFLYFYPINKSKQLDIDIELKKIKDSKICNTTSNDKISTPNDNVHLEELTVISKSVTLNQDNTKSTNHEEL